MKSRALGAVASLTLPLATPTHGSGSPAAPARERRHPSGFMMVPKLGTLGMRNP
jgi:hypothetical protein